MPYTIEPLPTRLRIWQQNLNKSDKAHYDLINTPLHKSWDILALQEPYIDALGNTKANSWWHVIYPMPHLANNTIDRSVLLINTALDVNRWAQIPVEDSNDVSAIQLHTPKGRITIFNLYVDCNHSEALAATCRTIRSNRQRILGRQSDSVVWCGDFNRHHAMWDEERNHHLFTASATVTANELISHLAEFHLTMTLPKGLPTLQAMRTKNWTRVDNVFMTEDLAELLICCDTAPSLRGPGTDHIPIHTVIDTGIPSTTLEPYRNYRTVDWKVFREELAVQLTQIPEPTMLQDDAQFQQAITGLTVAIQATTEVIVPLSKPVPHSRRWWNEELMALKKRLNKLNNESYKYRAIADHPTHNAHRDIRNKYGEAIKCAKTQHWQNFLETAQGPDIWTANWYISNPLGDSGRQRIPTLKVPQANGTSSEVTTNEEKAAAFHQSFFPPKPTTSNLPNDPTYPARVKYKFKLSKAQLH